MTAEVTGGKKPYTYQWLADGTAIPDADGETLAITEDMVGKKISVKVTDADGVVKTSEATTAVAKDLPVLKNVNQESSNQILLYFDSNASAIESSDIEVARAEDGLVNSVEKVELYTELDSTTLLATLSSPLLDGTDYDVTVGAVTVSLSASVGEVAAVQILTTVAEVNKPTKVEYKLLDEKGVDVTSTVKLKETVLADITGTYKTAKTSDPTDISVTMGTVDDKCEVTISYSTGEGEDEAITKTQTITCVGPSASKGTIKYERTNDVNLRSGCAKFYLEGVGTDNKVSIAVNETTEYDEVADKDRKPVYFSAFDDNGAAIEYDQYEVESANEAIVAASVRRYASSGKYAVIDLTGNEVGTTQVKVIATNNGKSKEYYMNVTVKNPQDMIKVTLSDSRDRKLSNAYDLAYTDEITASIVDENGDAANYEKIEWKLKNAENYKAADSVPTALQDTFGWANGTGYDGATTAEVKAWGAKGGTYTVEATADLADFTKTQTLRVTVSELPPKAWVGAKETGGQKLTYMVEVGESSIGNIGGTNTISLYAYTNGLFAGYVRQDEVTKATTGGKGAIVINSDLSMLGTEETFFKTNLDTATAGAVAIAGLTSADDLEADEVFTTVTTYASAEDGVDNKKPINTYQLSKYTYSTIPADTDLGGSIGAYWVAEEGEAIGGGAITIGLDGDGAGTVVANNGTAIAPGSLEWTLKFGIKQLATGQLYDMVNNANGAEEKDFYGVVIPVWTNKSSVLENPNTWLTYVAGDNKYDSDIARAGKYNVVFTYLNADTLKKTTAENEFTVTDSVKKYVPQVTLNSKTTSDYSLESFKEILTLNVDLNNNDGLAESLVEPGLMRKWTDVDGDGHIDEDERWMIDSSDKYAKYATVVDTVSDEMILFFVPVGANISED